MLFTKLNSLNGSRPITILRNSRLNIAHNKYYNLNDWLLLNDLPQYTAVSCTAKLL